jgi:hypothetical protein
MNQEFNAIQRVLEQSRIQLQQCAEAFKALVDVLFASLNESDKEAGRLAFLELEEYFLMCLYPALQWRKAVLSHFLRYCADLGETSVLPELQERMEALLRLTEDYCAQIEDIRLLLSERGIRV